MIELIVENLFTVKQFSKINTNATTGLKSDKIMLSPR